MQSSRKPGFAVGVGSALSGLGLIFRPRLRRFVLIPLLINIALFSAALYFSVEYIDAWLNDILPTWLDFARWIIWPLFAAGAGLVVFFTFTVVANLIGSPFNGILAEKTLLRLGGELPAQPQGSLVKEVPKAIGGEVQKISWFLLRAIPLLVLFLIPGINIIAPFAWFFFGVWYLAMEYIDFPLGNEGKSFAEQKKWLAAHKRATIGFGLVITAMTLIPIINFIAMPVAVTGATALWHRVNQAQNA